jgi:hypothetical protein
MKLSWRTEIKILVCFLLLLHPYGTDSKETYLKLQSDRIEAPLGFPTVSLPLTEWFNGWPLPLLFVYNYKQSWAELGVGGLQSCAISWDPWGIFINFLTNSWLGDPRCHSCKQQPWVSRARVGKPTCCALHWLPSAWFCCAGHSHSLPRRSPACRSGSGLHCRQKWEGLAAVPCSHSLSLTERSGAGEKAAARSLCSSRSVHLTTIPEACCDLKHW